MTIQKRVVFREGAPENANKQNTKYNTTYNTVKMNRTIVLYDRSDGRYVTSIETGVSPMTCLMHITAPYQQQTQGTWDQHNLFSDVIAEKFR